MREEEGGGEGGQGWGQEGRKMREEGGGEDGDEKFNIASAHTPLSQLVLITRTSSTISISPGPLPAPPSVSGLPSLMIPLWKPMKPSPYLSTPPMML